MVEFDYDDIMKRYNVLVPFTLAGESSNTTVASISEDDRLTLHRELKISIVRQILLHWDEQKHMRKMRKDRKKAEFDKYFEDTPEPNKKKGE